MRCLFFIGSMEAGGAERQLAQLARGFVQRGHTVVVATIYAGGIYWESLEHERQLKLYPLFPRKANHRLLVAWQLLAAAWQLRLLIHREKITVVYSMLYISNVVARLAVWGMKRVSLAWGIRSSREKISWKRYIFFHIGKWLSPGVQLLVSNSFSGLEDHERCGYRAQKHVVIANGIDTEAFRPCPQRRHTLRKEWRIEEQQKLIGIVARLSPVKGHPTFLHMAHLLVRERDDLKFVCVGGGAEGYRRQLLQQSEALGLCERLIWAGVRQDMAAVYNALDICVSSSDGESFSNAIGEAMSCGLPCVVTDVGDSARIVGDMGAVVVAGDARELCRGVRKMLAQLEYIDRQLIRERVVSRYRLERSISLTTKELTLISH